MSERRARALLAALAVLAAAGMFLGGPLLRALERWLLALHGRH